MKDLFYISKSGEVRWNKFPEEPKRMTGWETKGGLKIEMGGDFGYEKTMRKYQEAIQAAKDSSIVCADQILAKKIIGDNLFVDGAPTGYEPQTECFYPFPSEQYEVEVTIPNHDECGAKGEKCPMHCHSVCEKLENPKQVAVITPRKKEPNCLTAEHKRICDDWIARAKENIAKENIAKDKKALAFNESTDEVIYKSPDVPDQLSEHGERMMRKYSEQMNEGKGDRPIEELFVEKYYGLSPDCDENGKINTDYGDLVNLLTMFKEEFNLDKKK